MTELVTCKECGHGYKSLGFHVFRKHSMSLRDYKKKHGILLSKSLVTEDTSKKMSETFKKIKSVRSVLFKCKNCACLLRANRDRYVIYKATTPDGEVRKYKYCSHDCANFDIYILQVYNHDNYHE